MHTHNDEIDHYPDGSYIHFGLKNKLLKQLSTLESPAEQNDIYINANIDGIPLTRSTSSQFWPNIPGLNKPFEIDIFSSPLKNQARPIF
jgi:hypothetical protein